MPTALLLNFTDFFPNLSLSCLTIHKRLMYLVLLKHHCKDEVPFGVPAFHGSIPAPPSPPRLLLTTKLNTNRRCLFLRTSS